MRSPCRLKQRPAPGGRPRCDARRIYSTMDERMSNAKLSGNALATLWPQHKDAVPTYPSFDCIGAPTRRVVGDIMCVAVTYTMIYIKDGSPRNRHRRVWRCRTGPLLLFLRQLDHAGRLSTLPRTQPRCLSPSRCLHQQQPQTPTSRAEGRTKSPRRHLPPAPRSARRQPTPQTARTPCI